MPSLGCGTFDPAVPTLKPQSLGNAEKPEQEIIAIPRSFPESAAFYSGPGLP
jgi:hypothetical protein